MSFLEDAIEAHAEMAFDAMKNTLGDKWENIPERQKQAAMRATKRLVALEFKKRQGEDVDGDLAFVTTTVEGFKLAGNIALYDAFWEGMVKALEAFGSFLVGAGKGFIPGLGALTAGLDLGGFLSANS